MSESHTTSIDETLPDSADHVLVSSNPKAGSGLARGNAVQLVTMLRNQGLQVEPFTDLNEVSARANQLQTAGKLRALVAAGGDGTVAELVNRTDPGVPICILPLGTENLLAKHFGLHRGLDAVSGAISDGRVLRLDAGKAQGRLFLIMITCGLDAAIIDQMHKQRQGPIRHSAYIKPILHCLRSYQYPKLRIYCQSEANGDLDSVEPVVGRWAQAFNLPCYALGLKFVPEGDGADGQLDVGWFSRAGLLPTLWNYLCVLVGKHRRWTDFDSRPAKRVRIESDQPVPYQIDGDPGGMLPVEIEVVPRRFSLIVPRRYKA